MSAVVLHLVDSFRQGGSEVQAVQLVRLLHASGRYRVRLASLHSDGALRQQVEELGLDPIRTFPLTSFHDWNTLIQAGRLMDVLRGVDILQTHDFYSNVFGMAVGALARVPVRIAARRDTASQRTRVQKDVQSASYRLAHVVVANALVVKRTLIAEGVPDHKIAVVYNGLDESRAIRTEPGSREDLIRTIGLPSEFANRSIVSLVANMHLTIKDQETFLRAARRVHAVHPSAGFVLAGGGARLPALRDFATQFGIDAVTCFIGESTRIAELLAISEVCALSSLAEGLPNAVLEYMGAGRPVVATAVGGVPEAVVDGVTGYLVAPRDDASMAQHILELLRDPGRAQAMGAAGRRLVHERFSSETQRTTTEELYMQMLSRRLHASF